MNRIFLLVALAALLTASSARAEMFGPDYRPCGDRPNTPAIVECVNAKTKVWDQRLNAAYGTLQQRSSGEQAEALRTAQRLWIQYRDANCRFYGAEEGTIRQVKAAECLRFMTQERAREFEEAMRP
jgi:uncharacterized protein YecT (DUF1311 family)